MTLIEMVAVTVLDATASGWLRSQYLKALRADTTTRAYSGPCNSLYIGNSYNEDIIEQSTFNPGGKTPCAHP